MVGSKIVNRIENIEYSDLICKFAIKCAEAEFGHESIVLGTFLLGMDMDIIGTCDNGDELGKKILNCAKANGQYAGLTYDSGDFLDPEDEGFTAPDDGLSWVGFADIWDILESIANQV